MDLEREGRRDERDLDLPRREAESAALVERGVVSDCAVLMGFFAAERSSMRRWNKMRARFSSSSSNAGLPRSTSLAASHCSAACSGRERATLSVSSKRRCFFADCSALAASSRCASVTNCRTASARTYAPHLPSSIRDGDDSGKAAISAFGEEAEDQWILASVHAERMICVGAFR